MTDRAVGVQINYRLAGLKKVIKIFVKGDGESSEILKPVSVA